MAPKPRGLPRADRSKCVQSDGLSSIFAATSDLVLVLDAQGRCLKIESTSSPLLCKPPGELIGKTLHEILPKNDADLLYTCGRRALEESQMQRLEYCLHIGNRDVWFDACIAPISDSAVRWVVLDITNFKQAGDRL